MNTLSLFKILLAIPVLQAICYGQECDPNGISCINCTDYQKCSGGAPSGPIFSCKNGARCEEKPLLEHCWIKLNCFDLNECSKIGIFPDAMVESNYFVCLPDSGSGFIKYDFTCPEGEFFNENAQICLPKAATSGATSSLETTTAAQTSETTIQTPATSTSAPTPSPTPETTNTTQTPATSTSAPTPSPTPETTNTTQTPATSTSAPTPSPTPETTTTTQTPATSTSASTPSPTPETTTAVPTMAPTSPPSPFTCTAPGIFPNPTNCKMYFRCSTSLKVFNYVCPGTSYFNENILKCSLIITSACQEQILQNTITSTTPLPTTSATTRTPVPTTPSTTTITTVPTTFSIITTTTPTPKTATTTPSPTQAPTTTQVPSRPFACSAAGTFENPLDCKTYYRCNSSGKTFLYVCPNGSYYNEFTKRCGLTITPRCRSKLSY